MMFITFNMLNQSDYEAAKDFFAVYKTQISEEIRLFLLSYAKMNASEPDQYSSPDAYELENFAKMLDLPGQYIDRKYFPRSDWGAGGYKDGGEQQHDVIISDVTKLFELQDSLKKADIQFA